MCICWNEDFFAECNGWVIFYTYTDSQLRTCELIFPNIMHHESHHSYFSSFYCAFFFSSKCKSWYECIGRLTLNVINTHLSNFLVKCWLLFETKQWKKFQHRFNYAVKHLWKFLLQKQFMLRISIKYVNKPTNSP